MPVATSIVISVSSGTISSMISSSVHAMLSIAPVPLKPTSEIVEIIVVSSLLFTSTVALREGRYLRCSNAATCSSEIQIKSSALKPFNVSKAFSEINASVPSMVNFVPSKYTAKPKIARPNLDALTIGTALMVN